MVGKTISHYKILGMLGAGGMGEVYLAEDTELGRKVALKFLPPQSTTEADIKARFKHEAKAAAALNHPNIVTVYEVGEHEGQSYISMEYVEGESLKDLLAKQELSTNRVIEIASQICEGLSKAHQAGIVHRDIKPENILINSEGRVKIADFGLAKLGNVTKLTKESSTLGTLSYMSPEQIQGADVDQRSDIFSLGVVLYEIITRQLPFKGDYEATVSYSIVHEEPEPLARYKSGISEGLQHIVDKALDKNLDTRYQHVDDLLADLKRERLGSALTQAARASRTRKPIRAFMFAGTLILTTILLVTGYFFFSGEAESTERILIAVVDFLNETDEPELDGLSGMLITSLEQSRRLSVITRSRMLDMLKQLGRQDVERIDESLGREICQQANVGALLTATVSKLGKLYAIDLKVFDIKKNKHLVKAREQDEGQENVLNMLDKLAEKARKGLKEKEEEIQGARRTVAEVTTTNLEAYKHYFLGEHLSNKSRHEEALEEFGKAIKLDSTFALAYYRYAYSHWGRPSLIGRDALFKKWLEILDQIPDMTQIPEKERYLVDAMYAAASRQDFEAALPILKKMEQRYPNEKEILFYIGNFSFHVNDFAATVEYYQKVLTLDPQFDNVFYHLPEAYHRLGRHDEAVAVAKRLISINEDRGRHVLATLYKSHGFKPAREEAALMVKLRNDAETVRREMLQVKRNVPGNPEGKSDNPTYQRAVQMELNGDRQFQAQDFGAARDSFQQARGLYSQATDEILDLMKSSADVANQLMLEAKSKIDGRYHGKVEYQDAAKIEKEADIAYNNNSFPEATKRYEAARELYVAVSREPDEKISRESEEKETAQREIQSLTNKYKAFFESSDIQALKTLLDLTEEEVKNWSNFFRIAHDIKVHIQRENLQIRGNIANVDLFITIDYLNNKNRQLGTSLKYAWTFQKIGDEWIVSEVVLLK